MGRRLMDLHGIPLSGRPLVAYHEHNAAQVLPRLLDVIEAGQKVVYLSDAGTPAVADPGYRLARAVIEAGAGLSATPGPCAAIMALTLSGLPSDRFTFGGFAPNRSGQRQSFLRGFTAAPGTLIFYESPRRGGAGRSRAGNRAQRRKSRRGPARGAGRDERQGCRPRRQRVPRPAAQASL